MLKKSFGRLVPSTLPTCPLPQLSSAVGGVQVAVAPVAPAAAVTVMLAGQLVNVGGVRSGLQGSIALQATVVGVCSLILKSPSRPSPKVNQPEPPCWSVFCKFAPVPRWKAGPRRVTLIGASLPNLSVPVKPV